MFMLKSTHERLMGAAYAESIKDRESHLKTLRALFLANNAHAETLKQLRGAEAEAHKLKLDLKAAHGRLDQMRQTLLVTRVNNIWG